MRCGDEDPGQPSTNVPGAMKRENGDWLNGIRQQPGPPPRGKTKSLVPRMSGREMRSMGRAEESLGEEPGGGRWNVEAGPRRRVSSSPWADPGIVV